MEVFLLEALPYDPITVAEVPLLLSSGSSRNLYDGEKYSPRLKVSLDFSAEIFGGNVPGASTSAVGAIVIANPDGEYDYLLDFSWSGRNIEVKYAEDENTAYGSFELVYSGKAKGITAAESEILIILRDNSELLKNPIQPHKYLGTGGAEGGEDLKNKPKPLLYGTCYSLEPVFVDAVYLTYQLNDGVLTTLMGVFDRGIELTAGADYPNYAALVAVGAGSIAGGTYITCLAEGFIRLGAPAVGPLACDAAGFPVYTISDIIQNILLDSDRGNLLSGDLDLTSFSDFETSSNWDSGYFLQAADSEIQQVIEELVASVYGFWFYDFTGKVVIRRFTFSTPVDEIEEFHIQSIAREETTEPNWSVNLNYKKVWRPHFTDEISEAAAGADGNITTFVYQRSGSQPATPTGNGVPVGWSDTPPETGQGILWQTQVVQDSTGAIVVGSDWSVPFAVEIDPGYLLQNDANTTIGRDFISRVGGTSFDGFARTVAAITGPCTLQFTIDDVNSQFSIGLSEDPTDNTDHTDPDFRWVFKDVSGTIQVWPESDSIPYEDDTDTQIYVDRDLILNEIYTISYDGNYVHFDAYLDRYLSIHVGPDKVFYVDCAIRNGKAKNIVFRKSSSVVRNTVLESTKAIRVVENTPVNAGDLLYDPTRSSVSTSWLMQDPPNWYGQVTSVTPIVGASYLRMTGIRTEGGFAGLEPWVHFGSYGLSQDPTTTSHDDKDFYWFIDQATETIIAYRGTTAVSQAFNFDFMTAEIYYDDYSIRWYLNAVEIASYGISVGYSFYVDFHLNSPNPILFNYKKAQPMQRAVLGTVTDTSFSGWSSGASGTVIASESLSVSATGGTIRADVSVSFVPTGGETRPDFQIQYNENGGGWTNMGAVFNGPTTTVSNLGTANFSRSYTGPSSSGTVDVRVTVTERSGATATSVSVSSGNTLYIQALGA